MSGTDFLNTSNALQRFEAFRTSPHWLTGADLLAVLLAAALPWSTSIFLILALPLLAIVCGSVDVGVLRRSISRPASMVALAFFVLALSGVLWSEAGPRAGFHALGPLTKFLALPFLLYYFEVSKRSGWVIAAFLLSCVVLLVNSWVVLFDPGLAFKTGRCCGEDYGVPVKNYIDQSQEFALCLVWLISIALYCIRRNMWNEAAGLGVIALAFAANLIFVVVSRTAIVATPFMILVLAWRHWKMRGVLYAVSLGAVAVVAIWLASPHFRDRVLSTYSQYEEYRDRSIPSSVGKRLEFWRKSLGFFLDAPLFGHGTGSTLKLFEEAAIGRSAVSAEVIANPHNQTLNVAVQWGIAGVIMLYALWYTHLRMFWKEGLVAELGILLVVQNVVSSLFNSHLFDFTEGWLYVLGVSVAGGILAKHKERPGPLGDCDEGYRYE
ncbi:O-antigen ligase family protein [Bradyrhizobium sp.]|uniref:O-antigen ligase family protein n=1 Tax=Bradyrhizobium sp. TaxID=376 RepID=UPI001EB7616E|nr:O-antigen ligase family protein [Bradyrhizobium sp.]MBV8916556.1 O-antigen ligase family protein [Bradyrhizobium sp.]MBV9982412.1 O-antigen ligase family protein [Bradyrhizobium sp.]